MLKDLLQKVPNSVWGFLVLIIIVAIPIFGHLDELPIQLWDESRLANNALEMSRSGNLIVTTWAKVPDMWNTKPPFLIWQQALLIKLLGPADIAIRLPSAIAAFLTCFLLYRIAVKKANSYLLGLIIPAVLVSSAGYVALHGIRTGDYDSMLTLLITAYCFSFFFFIEEGKPKNLFLTFLFMTAAVLTKGVAGMMAAPTLALYALFRNKVLLVLKTRQFYTGLALFIVIVFGYYLLREHYNPGYIAAVRENELGNRFLNAQEAHTGDGWFYYDALINRDYRYWYLLIPVGIFTGLFQQDLFLKKLVLFSTLISAVFFAVISAAATKLGWYALPLFPFFATIIGTFLYTVVLFIRKIPTTGIVSSTAVLPLAFLFLVLFPPYREVCNHVLAPEVSSEDGPAHCLRLYLRGLTTEKAMAPTVYAVSQDMFYGPGMFYNGAMPQGNPQIRSTDLKDLKRGEKFIAAKESEKKYIDSAYAHKVLDSWRGLEVYEIE